MDVLLNWLWQGFVIAVAAAAVLRVIPPSRTQARYCVAWIACVLVLALPALPWFWAFAPPAGAAEATASVTGPVVSVPEAWWSSAAMAVFVWLSWTTVAASRFAVAAVALRRARLECRPCPRDVEDRFPHWSSVRTTGRRTRLVLSGAVRSAGVLGGGPPVIAVSPALLDQLDDPDLDRVLIHEWAHVQRRDDVAQIGQLIVRVIAGWHPAIWWLERQLEFEREVACDEIAVAVTGSAKRYASCLASLAAMPAGSGRSVPLLAALPSSGLRRRLLRILSAPRASSSRRWPALAIAASTVLVTLALVVGNVRLVELRSVSLTLPGAPSWRPAFTLALALPPPPASLERIARPAPGQGSRGARISGPSRAAATRGAKARGAGAGRPGEVPSPALTAPPLQPLGRPNGHLVSLPGAAVPRLPEPPVPSVGQGGATPAPVETKPSAPWMVVADVGAAMGRGSQNAGTATAGFFSRFGRKIARSF